jgi:ADP-heptose:LPS heptosyltransferase
MDEPRETLYEFAGYMQGKGLALTQTSLFHSDARTPDVSCYETRFHNDLSLFKDHTLNYVILGDILATLTPEARIETTNNAARLLQSKAYLLLALPTKTFTPEGIEEQLQATGVSFRHISTYSYGSNSGPGQNFYIYKRLGYGERLLEKVFINTPVAKRVCVSRLGAIGDMIQCTPLLRSLKESNYHVTVNCSPYSASVLKGNPNVDNIIVQERNIIPNCELGPYWDYWAKAYTKYINLSETIEGPLLKVQGRRDYYTSKRWRSTVCDTNYFQRVCEKGGYYQANLQPELFISANERSAAKNSLRNAGLTKKDFIIIGVLNGSSHHKTYPLFPAVLNDWLDANPQARLILMGDKNSGKYAWEHPSITNLCGRTTLREAFALVQASNLVVGPETSLTNAAACFPNVAKIIFLSHSSRHNLTWGWKNTQALTPTQALAPCYPCHQLHYTLDSCPNASLRDDETGEEVSSGPRCALGAISGDRTYEALDRAYNVWMAGSRKGTY